MGWSRLPVGSEAWCGRILARDYPCGLVPDDRGWSGMWLSMPDPGSAGRKVVTVGLRHASGRVVGGSHLTRARGRGLEAEVATRTRRLPRDGTRPDRHGFCTTVLLACLWGEAVAEGPARTMRSLAANGPQAEAARRRLCLAGALPNPVDALIMSGTMDGGMGSLADRTATAQACVDAWCLARVAPFLDGLVGPGVELMRGLAAPDAREGYVRARVEALDDAAWEALDEADPRSDAVAATLRALPHHHGAVLRSAVSDPRAFSDGRAATLGRVMRGLAAGVAPATADAYAREHARWRATLADPMEAAMDGIGRRNRHMGTPGMGPATVGLIALARMPHDWVPRGEPEWDAFLDLVPALVPALETLGPGRPAQAFVNARGRWRELRARLVRAAGVPPHRLPEAVRDREDVVRALAAQVVTPALLLAGAGRARWGATRDPEAPSEALARRVLSGEASLAASLEASARWHREEDAIRARLAGLGPGGHLRTAWEPGLPDDDRGDVQVTCVRDAAGLVAEGRKGAGADGTEGLAHCVGGYADRCASGEVRILSLRRRSPEGIERLSTAEVAIVGGRADAVVQHRGRRNAEPPEGCGQALARYLARVASGDLPSRPVPRVDLPRRARAHDAAGYDWGAPGAWEAARDAWSPHLPRTVRGWDAARFAAEAGFAPGEGAGWAAALRAVLPGGRGARGLPDRAAGGRRPG